MIRRISRGLVTIFLFLNFFIGSAIAENVSPEQTISNCIVTGLPKVIAGEDVKKYISLSNFSLNAVGIGNWKSLNESGREELMALLLKTIKKKAAAEIQSQIARGLDPYATTASVEAATLQKNGLYAISGIITSPSGTPYDFTALVSVKGKQCTLHSILVAGAFSIAQDLGTDPDIQAFMKKYKLKR